MQALLVSSGEKGRAMLAELMRGAGPFDFTVAGSGSEARRLSAEMEYDLVLLEGFKSSGWPKIEVVRSAISDAPVSFQPLAVVGDIPGADFDLNDIPALADWIEAQMPAL